MAGGEESSSSGYGALNVTRFLPTQSRSREELILQTYGEGNGPLEVGDDGTTRSIFNDDGGDVQLRFGSNVGSDGGGAGGGSTSKC
jgi:hypothetical protein